MDNNSASILFYMALGFMGTPLLGGLIYFLVQAAKDPRKEEAKTA